MLSFPRNHYLLPFQRMNLLEISLFLELKTEFLTDRLEAGDAILESILFYAQRI